MEYRGIVKERDKRMTGLFVFLALFMMGLTLITHKWFYIPMALLVILACFYKREHIISEDGVDIKSTLFGHFTRHDLWKWEEINSLQTDEEKAAPNIQLLITKDIVIRAFVMTRPDIRGVFALARKMNPDIIMDDMSEEEKERRDAEILHRQEIQNAQRKAAKKRKK